MSSAPANWYPDPHEADHLRYWDGTMWTEHVRPVAAQADSQEAPAEPTHAPSPQQRLRRDVQREAEPTKIGIFGARKHAAELARRNAELEQSMQELGALREQAGGLAQRNAELEQSMQEFGAMDIVQRRETLAHLEAQIAARTKQAEADFQRRAEELEAGYDTRQRVLEMQLEQLRGSLSAARGEMDELDSALVTARGHAQMQAVGLFNYHHVAESSVQLKELLDSTKAKIKQMVRDKSAATKSTGFSYNNSRTEGTKFVNDLHAMMLAAYNAEAENCVKSVKAGNLQAAVKRLDTARDRIAKRGTWIGVGISSRYHALRVKEMQLAADYWLMKQEEKEAERARREELREQKKAEQEIAAAKAKLEKERQHYANLIATLEAAGDVESLEEARAHYAEAERAIQDVDYRAANVRAGYVYVISNIGAFGEGVVKIGMTRRLEPMDRVNELGDASVPFRFDVHTLYFSTDAVSLEGALHAHFADRRLNKVNLRREFFYATPTEVLEVLKQHAGAVTEYTETAEAEEFRLSRGELADAF